MNETSSVIDKLCLPFVVVFVVVSIVDDAGNDKRVVVDIKVG